MPLTCSHTKGLHLTIYGSRDDRGPEGWRVCPKGSAQLLSFWRAHDDEQKGNGHHCPPPPAEDEGGPERVIPMPRLRRDAQALLELTSTDDPP